MQTIAAALNEDEQVAFWKLLDDYRAAAKFVHGQSFVSVKVLAELAKLGWRRP